MRAWVKETTNENGKYYRVGDWSVEVDKLKNNMTEVAPPAEAFEGVPYSWDGKGWVKNEAAAKKVYDKLRKREYPDIGDQLDAIWKQLNQDRLGGKALIQDADDMLGQVLSIKAKWPKEKE